MYFIDDLFLRYKLTNQLQFESDSKVFITSMGFANSSGDSKLYRYIILLIRRINEIYNIESYRRRINYQV